MTSTSTFASALRGLLLLPALLVLGGRSAPAQTAVPVGAGSYASFPPAAMTQGGLGDFIHNQPLYVPRSKQTGPIPTNDWWTDLLVRGKDSGLLWVYPLVADAEPDGFKLNFPTTFTADGSNMEYGGHLHVTAAGYTPSTALADSWTDWGLTMTLPDTVRGKNLTVTMAHGVPFVWVETQGVTPEFSFERDASYLTAAGAPLTLPSTGSFVVNTDGRYFGVHVPAGSTAQLLGQQYVRLDLGTVRNLSQVKLYWENAYASGYAIQVSDDAVTWRTAFTETNGDGNLDDLALPAGTTGRYVKLALSRRGTNFAYSLYELQVFDGATLVSQGQPVVVTSTQTTGGFVGPNVNDGNFGSRWASDGDQRERLVLSSAGPNGFFVVSALNQPADLTAYDAYAFNKVTDTRVSYQYDAAAGKVQSDWQLTTTNLQTGQAGGPTLQGFLPHLYQNAAHSVGFGPYSYVSPRGALKMAAGTSFRFTYDFQGVLPSYNAPYRNPADVHPYDATAMYNLVTAFAGRTGYKDETYFGGKDILNFAKFTLLAKELNHQAYPILKARTRAALVNWLTYSPGEADRYFARYDRWGAFIGFNTNFNSGEFVDNHFHYGYFTLACALYGMVDQDFLAQYGDIARLIAKQYANWDRTDQRVPWMRTFDPWVGHSYAGGTSSAIGNNQESSSEAMQSWMGLFLLGDMLGDAAMREAGAFGYSSESYAALEYWFDWKRRNLPPAYTARHRMGAILSNQGLGHVTYFGDYPHYVHGIEYLPVNPGLSYLARDPAWAQSEYQELLAEGRVHPGRAFASELDYGEDDWTHVVWGFRLLFDPEYVTGQMEANYQLAPSDPHYVMDDREVAGLTYFYAHANQNLGAFSTRFHTDFPASSVFERNGAFAHAVVYNATAAPRTATVYDAQGAAVASAVVPAYTLLTFPALPATGATPGSCYNLLATGAAASSSMATPSNARLAIDGDQGSRWESQFTDPQQLTVDYGRPAAISTVTIAWENASAKDYTLLGSLDSVSWQPLGARTNQPTLPAGQTRTDVLPITGGPFRYLRMAGTSRTTPYGYSIYELTACGTTSTATATPLPVQLTDFMARAVGPAVALSWHTASELNSARFEVERSLDGRRFTAIGSVPARGSSTSVAAYRYLDAAVPAGHPRLYYRLRQVDQDASSSYSAVRTVDLARASLTLHPNPTRTATTLTGATPGSTIYLLDTLGRSVAAATADAAGTATLVLPAGLPAGVYLVRANGQALRLLVQ